MSTDVLISPTAPEIRRVTREDIQAALSAGIADFRAAPRFGLFFGGIYAGAGILIWLQLLVWDRPIWIVPLALAFPLIGPFVAVGLYEVSRRREAGEPLVWDEILAVIWRQRGGQLPYLAFVVMAGFMVWIWFARLIVALFLGRMEFATYSDLDGILTTTPGLAMLVVGSAVGAVIAFVIFALSAVSLPMLLEREVDFVTAMITSFRSVTENLPAMLGWGIVIAGLLFLAMIPFFLGLVVVLPILGHATWHVYRAAIVPPPTAAVGPEGSRRAGRDVTL
jgi:uncharacterized membrane protein